MFYRIHHLLPMLIKSIIYFKKNDSIFFFFLCVLYLWNLFIVTSLITRGNKTYKYISILYF
jgi:hypothetical protein